jgi:membrane fusion protein (multidrug efflux system)
VSAMGAGNRQFTGPAFRKKAACGSVLSKVVKAVIILGVLAALVAIAKMPGRKREVPPSEPPPVNVTVMTVTAEPELPETFDIPGVIEPNRIVDISAEVAGRIERIPLEEGSSIRAGDLLIQLDTDLLQPQFDIAEAQFKRDQIEFDRMNELVKQEATATRDLDDAVNKLAISRASLEEIRARLERTRILAPIDGVLNDLLVEMGEYVQPGGSVATVVDIALVKAAVEVPERDIGFFAVGQKAAVFADVKGEERTFEGTITFISELADSRTRSTRIELTLDNRERILRSGQIVRVGLTRRVLRDAIMIPLLAVIPMEDGKTVYVVKSSQAERRQVELDIIRGDRVQVTRGLEAGEQLVIAGHRFIAPGQKVNVVPEEN